jgi:serine protease Do
MSQSVFKRGVIAVAVAALVAGGGFYAGKSGWGYANAAVVGQTAAAVPAASSSSSQTSANPPQAVTTTVSGMATATDFSGIVDRYGPAVVNITTLAKAQQSPAVDDLDSDDDDPFSEFFRRFGPQIPRMPRGGGITRGMGSGFIISPDGLIMTNAHVVDGAQEVTVKLTDRREYRAKVLGVDKKTDIAVIRIDAKSLPTVRLGDPSAAKVGEPVLAIGAPFGFENSATAGIISAKSRSLPEDTYVPFIQTDVAVNPGNSGGPLFNLKGEVIGINSQIYSRTGGFQGLSFAIPIDVAVKVQDQLVKHGKVTRGRLGVSIQEVTQQLADSFGLKNVQGALVAEVEKGAPADRAGLEPGDVITAYNGREVNHSADLPALVAETAPGTTVKIEVVRKGGPKTLTATITEQKDKAVAKLGDDGREQGRLGLAVRPLAKEEQRQVGVNGGLLVEDVAGPAEKSGIRPGDIVLSINGTPVQSGEQLRSLAAKSGKHAALLVQRGNAKIFVPIELG